MSYLKLFEQWANDIAIPYQDARIVNENQESVGREFQHIEDLVYIYGIPGIKRAIERLEAIGKSNKHMEIKWDGSPAITFGRDENGSFHLGDKYTKEIVDSSEKVYQQYVGRSGANVSDERREFASSMSELWKLYESATPKDFRGYIEAGLLYKTTPPLNKQGEYVFQPNTVIYHVDKNSELGKRIGASITGSAATAYFDNLPALGGNRITTDLSNVIRGIGNRSVVIVPPKYATDVQVQMPTEKLNKLKSYVSQVGNNITEFITPSQEWIDSYPDEQTATKKWREVIYKYVNSQVDNPQGMENLGSNMAQWAETDPLLTKARRPLAIAKIKQDQSNMQATFLVVRSIMHLKDTIVDQMENKTLGSLGIRAELPGGAPGGEGFVSDPAGGSQPLKFVKRGTFTAANREKNRPAVNENAQTRDKKINLVEFENTFGKLLVEQHGRIRPNLITEKTFQHYASKHKIDTQLYRVALAQRIRQVGSITESKEESTQNGKTAVVGWGRGMGHKGHMYLAESVIDYANKIGATPFFFVSETVGADDPLEPKTKLEIYRRVFPQHSEIFRTGKTPVQVLEQVRELGYTNVVFMVGEDQRDSFQWLTKPTKSTGNLPAEMQSIKVMSRQESGSKTSQLSGPRATPMRDALKDASMSFEEKFKIWRDAMPEKLTDAQVKKIMSIAAKRMNVELKLSEADLPPGGSTSSAIPGTPHSLQPEPDKKEIEAYHRELQSIKRFMHHDDN